MIPKSIIKASGMRRRHPLQVLGLIFNPNLQIDSDSQELLMGHPEFHFWYQEEKN